jgi:hypothetical protein
VFVTVIGPLVALAGTTATSLLGSVRLATVAGTPSKFTVAVEVNPFPMIVTSVPYGPLAGANEASVNVTSKLEELLAVPPGVVTETFPLVAPLGTTALTDVPVSEENAAVMPLNLTAEAAARFVPVIVTIALPASPLVGENPDINGGDESGSVTAPALESATNASGPAARAVPAAAPNNTAPRPASTTTRRPAANMNSPHPSMHRQ